MQMQELQTAFPQMLSVYAWTRWRMIRKGRTLFHWKKGATTAEINKRLMAVWRACSYGRLSTTGWRAGKAAACQWRRGPILQENQQQHQQTSPRCSRSYWITNTSLSQKQRWLQDSPETPCIASYTSVLRGGWSLSGGSPKSRLQSKYTSVLMCAAISSNATMRIEQTSWPCLWPAMRRSFLFTGNKCAVSEKKPQWGCHFMVVDKLEAAVQGCDTLPKRCSGVHSAWGGVCREDEDIYRPWSGR